MSIIEPLIRPSNTGTAYNILKLSDGRYWVAISANNSTSGTFIKNRDGSDSPFLLPVANPVLIIVEYNQDGFATKWTQSRCNRMSEAPDGSIYVMVTEGSSSYNIFNFTTTSTLPSATFTLSTSGIGVILIKYTREGIAESWTKIDRGDNDFANGLFIDTNGDLYVSTRFQSTANSSNAGYSIFGFTTTNTLPTATFTIPNTPVATHSTFYTRYAIIAFNSNGTPKWWSAPNVNSNHIMADLLMDDTYLYASGSSGGSYAGSTARDNIAIPTRNFSITNTLGTAPFSIPAPSNRTGANIVKWNKTTGVAHSWVRIPSIGNDISSSVFMTLDNQGNLYVCGTYNTTTAVDVKNFHTENNDTHPVIFSLPATTGNAIFIVKWDSSGNAVGWTVIDGTGSDTATRIAFDPVYKLVYFVGNYISTNPLQIRNFTETNTTGDTVITLPVSSVSKSFLVAWNTSGIVKKYKIIDSVLASTSGFIRIQDNTIMYVGNYNSDTPVKISNISNTEYDGSDKYLLQSGTVALPFFNTYDLDGNVFLTKPNKVLNTLEFNPLEFNNSVVVPPPENVANVWVTRSSAADNEWRSVIWAYELGLFVAVAGSGNGNRVMTSPDGITWTSRVSAADNNWYL
jgi:hypothetical protein